MPLRQNPDGTFDVLDYQTGEVKAAGVPPNMLPPNLYNEQAAAPAPAEDLRVAGPMMSGASEAAASPSVPLAPTPAPEKPVTQESLGSGYNVPMPVVKPQTKQEAATAQSLVESVQQQSGAAQTETAKKPLVGDPNQAGQARVAGAGGATGETTFGDIAARRGVLNQYGFDLSVRRDEKGNVLVGPDGKPILDVKRLPAVYSPGRKGGPRKVSAMVQEGKTLAPDTLEMIDTYYADREKVAEQTGKDLETQYMKQAIAFQVKKDELEDEIQHRQERANYVEQESNRRLGMLNKKIEDVRRLSKEDPVERYWNRKGTFGTVLAKVGIALGALGSSLAGGPNHAYQLIRDEINDEIGFQKTQLAAAGDAVALEKGVYAEWRANSLSPQAAEAASRALLTEKFAAELGMLESSMKGAESKAAIRELIAKLRGDVAEFYKNYDLMTQGDVKTAYKFERPVPGGYSRPGKQLTFDEAQKVADKVGVPVQQIYELFGSGDKKFPTKGAADRAGVEKQSARNRAAVVLPGNQGTAFAVGGAEGHKISEKLFAIQDFVDAMQTIKRYVDEGGQSIPRSVLNQKIKVINAFQASRVKKAFLGEALTSGEYDVLWKNITGEAALNWLQTDNTAKAMLDQAVNEALREDASTRSQLISDYDDLNSRLGQAPDASLRKHEPKRK